MSNIYMSPEDRFYKITTSWGFEDEKVKDRLLSFFSSNNNYARFFYAISYYLDLLFPGQPTLIKLWLHSANKQFSINGTQCSPLHLMQNSGKQGIHSVEMYLRNQLQG